MKIVKRDGSLELFRVAKLRRCVGAVLRESRCDERIADDLARAVALHVQGWEGSRPPTTEYVFRCVRTALRETGHEEAAQRLEHQHRVRAARRRAVSVSDVGPKGGGKAPWRKGDVVDALRQEHKLKRSVARILGGEIESRVLGLGYRVVSTALVKELIRSELLAWGLADRSVLGVEAAVSPDAAAQMRKEN